MCKFSLKESTNIPQGVKKFAELINIYIDQEFLVIDLKKNRSIFEDLATFSHLGLTMAGCILFCFAIGYFLDKWLGTKGLFLTIFIILGVIGGGVTVYRQINEVLHISKKNEESDRENKNG